MGGDDRSFHGEKRLNNTRKGYDTRDFLDDCRSLNVTPHVAPNTSNRSSRIDDRATRQVGYALSQHRQKQVADVLGWMKTAGLMRRVRHRGHEKLDWMFVFTAAAYNLVQLRGLAAAPTYPRQGAEGRQASASRAARLGGVSAHVDATSAGHGLRSIMRYRQREETSPEHEAPTRRDALHGRQRRFSRPANGA